MTVSAAIVADVRSQWKADRPVVLPTDTVYGLVAPAASEVAVARMFALKHRPIDLRMAVLVADLSQAAEWIDVTDEIRRLADHFWPGALTVVGVRRPGVPRWVGDDSTLAVRCPDDLLLRTLATEFGPLAASSANVHGESTPLDAEGVAAALPSVELVVDGGPCHGEASTVVVVGEAGPTIVRDGAIPAADINAVRDASS